MKLSGKGLIHAPEFLDFEALQMKYCFKATKVGMNFAQQ